MTYRECSNCVMDTSDPQIMFDQNGVCSHCHEFYRKSAKIWFPNKLGEQKLQSIFSSLKKRNKNRDYDCIIGLSGGIDGSYLALVLKRYNLRALAVHVDAGWNSEVSVGNIHKIIEYCKFDLVTQVVDWREVRDLQLAYLKSNIANQDAVQDHAFFANLYKTAVKYGIKNVFSGGNLATESVFPNSWHHPAMDAINLRAIHKQFGEIKLKSFSTISFFEYYFWLPYIKRMKVFRPLNYIEYSKTKALQELRTSVDFQPYGRKHGESRFTKFFQNYYLPKKFGYDKRRPHLSSLILSGLISRDEAMKELSLPLYDDIELKNDKSFIANKLGITISELDQMISAPGRHYSEFRNWDRIYKASRSLKIFLERKLGKSIANYS